MFCVLIVGYVCVADGIIFPLLSFAHKHLSEQSPESGRTLLQFIENEAQIGCSS